MRSVVRRLLVGRRDFLGWRWRAQPRSSAAAVTDTAREPNGFLFNEKPILPGEKRGKEGWENAWVYGMSLNFLLLFIVAAFKPDTSVRGWARERALQRVDAWEASLKK